MKKVLFYSALTFTPHWEIELNLMEKYLREGWRVVLMRCDADLPACLANPHHTFAKCLECRTRKDAGLKWLDDSRIEVKPFYYINKEDKAELEKIRNLEIISPEQIDNFTIDGSDVGKAALSSARTSLRESQIDVRKHQKILKNYLLTAAISHYSATRRIAEEKPDEVILFNGRLASARPVLRAAWKQNVSTVVHEAGKVSGRFFMVRDNFLHSLKGLKSMINEAFETSELPFAEMKKLAAEWFTERRNKSSKNQLLYIQNQEKSRLPENFTNETINVVIFNSSEDEFAGFDEFKNPLYENQNDAIQKILADFQNQPNFRFFVRIHPNLKKLQNSQINFLYDLAKKYDALTLIEPESKVDSYKLLEVADILIVFNSTIGIEAVFAGKTPILLGVAVYENFGGFIKPQSHAELLEILRKYEKTKTLPPVENAEEAWVKFGYFMSNGGFIPEFVEKTDWWHAKMKRDGKLTKIKPSILSRILNFSLRSREQINQKLFFDKDG